MGFASASTRHRLATSGGRHLHTGDAALVALVLLIAGTALAACASSSPSSAPPLTSGTAHAATGTAASAQARSAPQQQLRKTLAQLDSSTSALSSQLGTMRASNAAGATFSGSGVESVTSPVTELLQLSFTELAAARPTLPPSAASPAVALSSALGSVLDQFAETNGLVTAAGGTGTSALPGLASGRLDAVSGGSLIPQYQDDVAAATRMESTVERQFLAVLG